MVGQKLLVVRNWMNYTMLTKAHKRSYASTFFSNEKQMILKSLLTGLDQVIAAKLKAAKKTANGWRNNNANFIAVLE